MDVVYASDNGFCRHMAASMFSLLDRNAQEDISLHVLSNGISEENRDALRDMADGFGRELRFYELGDLGQALAARVPGLDTGRFHPATLARLLIGSLLPETVERALYLDADTIVLGSLRGLWSMTLNGCVAAAAAEPTIYPQVRELLGLKQADCYFNAGVLLLDLAAWRREGLEQACFDYYVSMGGRLPFNDQDVLNAVLRGRVSVLPQKYNFFSNYYYYRYRTLAAQAAWYGRFETAESYAKARRHPAIVHFAGDERPWIAGNRNHYRRAYSLYLNATPWANTPKDGGKRLYMAAYHLMNLLTWFAPGARRLISGRYYENHIRDPKLQ